jgi:uncharacterized protein
MHAPVPTDPSRVGRERGLAYALFLPEGEPKGAVVVLHGWGSRKENHYDFAARARARGLAALVFDARGHGKSDGVLCPGAVDDALAMGELVRAHAPRVSFRGSSMGGFCALHAAARREDTAAVVAVCPAPAWLLRIGLATGTLDGVRADRRGLEEWLLSAALEGTVRALRGRTAVMLVHAEDDELVPASGSRELYEIAEEPRRLVLVPGGDHTSAQHDPDVQEESLSFILEASAVGDGARP